MITVIHSWKWLGIDFHLFFLLLPFIILIVYTWVYSYPPCFYCYSFLFCRLWGLCFWMPRARTSAPAGFTIACESNTNGQSPPYARPAVVRPFIFDWAAEWFTSEIPETDRRILFYRIVLTFCCLPCSGRATVSAFLVSIFIEYYTSLKLKRQRLLVSNIYYFYAF